ncbi:hypothetical protein P4O66_005679, partial [Electrophorus voltai]
AEFTCKQEAESQNDALHLTITHDHLLEENHSSLRKGLPPWESMPPAGLAAATKEPKQLVMPGMQRKREQHKRSTRQRTCGLKLAASSSWLRLYCPPPWSGNNTMPTPAQDRGVAEVFSPAKAAQLPPCHSFDCVINLKGGAVPPPRCRVYPLSQEEEQVMEQYIKEALAQGYIRPSASSALASVFYVKKKGSGLRPHTREFPGRSVFAYVDDILICLPSFRRRMCGIGGLRAYATLQAGLDGPNQWFLGFASFYRRFIQSISTLASPLTDLLHGQLKWTPVEDTAF